MYFFTFLKILLIGFQTTSAQQAKISGKVLDAKTNQAVEAATVSLRSLSDTTKVFGTKSKDKGQFVIEKIPFGVYRLSVSYVGYDTYQRESLDIQKKEIDLSVITLESGDKNLKAVKVVGERNAIELGIDKKTFLADKNITSAGGTAIDLLRNVPSVNVDMDGNVGIRGKENVTLFVDGKPSAMFGSDPQTALQNIPAASIESIEVITNPSSKYDAQGMNGIINIVLKKDRKAGYNAMINVGASVPYRLNGGINLNANTGKWNYFVNANARTSKTWEKTDNKRSNYTDAYTYTSYLHNDRRPLSGFMNLGAEYNPNRNNKFTFSQSIFNAHMKGNSLNTIDNSINYQTLISRQVRRNEYTGMPLSFTSNLQYKHQFNKPKEELNMELNFSKMRYLRESFFDTELLDSNLNVTNSFRQENPVKGGNYNITVQADYVRPLGDHARIEFGERSYFIRFKSENQPTIQYLNQPEIPETILKNHFRYTQQVHALYTNYANQFGKTGIQMGLRAEYFNYDGFVYQYNTAAGNSYLSLFPTMFVTHKVSQKEDLNLNYSRRVNRPGFMQIIPFIDVTNPQDTSMGNPALRPEFIHALELSYSYQYGKSNTLLASAYYQYTHDLVQRYRRFNANGTTFSQNQNLATGVTYGFELTNRMNIKPWWDFTINLNVFRNKIDGANLDALLVRDGYGGFVKLISNTRFVHGYSLQLTGNANARTVVSQGHINPYGFLDLAVKKTLWKGMANVTLTLNDAFNTLETETLYNLYPYYNQLALRKNLTRIVGFNFQIRLASRSMLNNPDAVRKPSSRKEKETKNREENLKKDEGGNDENGGGGQRDQNR